MSRRPLSLLVVCVGFGLTLSACGSRAASTAIRVGDRTISRATVGKMAATVVGGDFFQATGLLAPIGLVTDPPTYARCIAVAGVTRSRPTQSPGASHQQLRGKCEQLAHAVRRQAVEYLLDLLVTEGQDAELGIKVDEREVQQLFERIRSERFPRPAELARYLADRRWTLADELWLVRKDLLSSKLLAGLQHRFGSESESAQRYFKESSRRWIEKTSCSPGYVVEQCKPGTISKGTPTASPATLIEEIVMANTRDRVRP